MHASVKVMPVSARITAAHEAKHAKAARDWCPLCVGAPAPAPKRASAPATPRPAQAPAHKPVPVEVSDSARILLAFLGEFDLGVNGEILRALAGPSKRTRKPGNVPAGHPLSRNGHPLRGAALANAQAKAKGLPPVHVPTHVWNQDIPVIVAA